MILRVATLVFCLLFFLQNTQISSATETEILDSLGLMKKKSPLGAVLRSLVLPGWGQVYVEQYWKAPIFLGGAVIMYYYVYKHHKDFLDYSRRMEELKKLNPSDPNLHILKIKRENSLDNRDISLFFLCGVYALSMLDSYVNSHLFNFNVTDDIVMRIVPTCIGIRFDFSIYCFK
ncbi:MAG: DUF5683 domain-containing protein [Ignavibacteria bacterium]|nr:DUF5683 domain-containing protein [Ignavibacteria bacterium]